MTAPYVSPEGFHRHRCPDCGFVWEHSDNCSGLPAYPRKLAHLCPGCGAEERFVYSGESPPDPLPQPAIPQVEE